MAIASYRTANRQCIFGHNKELAEPGLGHEEAERMSQDTGSDTYPMPSHTPPPWALNIEHGGQGTEDRFYAMAYSTQDATDVVRPLFALVVLAQGHEHNPSFTPQAFSNSASL
jgi:hypothetical protein